MRRSYDIDNGYDKTNFWPPERLRLEYLQTGITSKRKRAYLIGKETGDNPETIRKKI